MSAKRNLEEPLTNSKKLRIEFLLNKESKHICDCDLPSCDHDNLVYDLICSMDGSKTLLEDQDLIDFITKSEKQDWNQKNLLYQLNQKMTETRNLYKYKIVELANYHKVAKALAIFDNLIKEDITIALNLLLEAVADENGPVKLKNKLHYYIGYIYKENLERNLVLTKYFWEQGLKVNDPNAICALANLYYFGIGVEKNINQAFNLIKTAVATKNGSVLIILSRFYEEGIMVEKNLVKAEKLSILAANRGEINSLIHTAQLLKLVARKNTNNVARQLFYVAASNGSVKGCLEYGKCLYGGIGGTQNINLSISYFTKAANNNIGEAFYYLAKEQEKKNILTKAFSLYKKSFNFGFIQAATDLSWAYQKGLGVDKNLEKAKEFYELNPVKSKYRFDHVLPTLKLGNVSYILYFPISAKGLSCLTLNKIKSERIDWNGLVAFIKEHEVNILEMNYIGITKIPSGLNWGETKLKQIYLGANKLTCLPEDFAYQKNLEVLNLALNPLSKSTLEVLFALAANSLNLKQIQIGNLEREISPYNINILNDFLTKKRTKDLTTRFFETYKLPLAQKILNNTPS